MTTTNFETKMLMISIDQKSFQYSYQTTIFNFRIKRRFLIFVNRRSKKQKQK